MLHEELTAKILEACFEVSNELGSGFLESVYEKSLLIALTQFNPTLVFDEWTWIVVAIGSYLLSWLASWLKFRCLPSYHTWAAKGAWVFVGAGIVCLVAGWTPWPFRLAMLIVVLANLEAVLITLTIARCQINVASLWHALRRP